MCYPIVLIDPKQLTRFSILGMLAKAFPDCATVAISSCQKLLEIGKKSTGRPRPVIIHIRSAGILDSWVQNPLELVRLQMGDAPVIVLSDRDDSADILTALTRGVRGYVPTSVDVEVASAALNLVDAGGTFIPAHVMQSLPAEPDIATKGEQRGAPDTLNLTPPELSVLDLLRDGKPNKLIAIELKMPMSTVKVHVRAIIKKLHAANRTHAASVADRLLGHRRTAASPLPPRSEHD